MTAWIAALGFALAMLAYHDQADQAQAKIGAQQKQIAALKAADHSQHRCVYGEVVR